MTLTSTTTLSQSGPGSNAMTMKGYSTLSRAPALPSDAVLCHTQDTSFSVVLTSLQAMQPKYFLLHWQSGIIIGWIPIYIIIYIFLATCLTKSFRVDQTNNSLRCIAAIIWPQWKTQYILTSQNWNHQKLDSVNPCWLSTNFKWRIQNHQQLFISCSL